MIDVAYWPLTAAPASAFESVIGGIAAAPAHLPGGVFSGK